MKIGLVTVTYNSQGVLPKFLASVLNSASIDLELTIVDNASSDGTLELVKSTRDDRIVLIANKSNLGVAAANNIGINHLLQRGLEWVLILNNDIEFDPLAIRKLLDTAIAKKARIAACKILYHSHPTKLWYAGGRISRWTGFGAKHFFDGQEASSIKSPDFVEYAPTCFLLVGREVFCNIGLMWEPYFVYSDDSDFVYRARKSGYKIAYLGEVEVFHRVGYLTGGSKSAFSRFYGTRNRVLMIRRHAKGLEVYILAWAYLATIWIRSKLKREPAIEFQQRAEGYKNAWGIQTR